MRGTGARENGGVRRKTDEGQTAACRGVEGGRAGSFQKSICTLGADPEASNPSRLFKEGVALHSWIRDPHPDQKLIS